MTEAALWLQRLYQLLERQVLMSLRAERRFAYPINQGVDAQASFDLATQHLSVDEETDQAFGLSMVAVGDRHAHTNVRLTTIAFEQHLE
ncbi:hypothetical protein Q3H58_004848 [Pseudomonas psychrotolerans]|nr:hypothetical protein [Pseudomonas psychrotolerans]